MKPAAAALAFLFLFLGILPSGASLLPADWQNERLANVMSAPSGNAWFFWPEAANSLRIFNKGISGNNSTPTAFITGGPIEGGLPAWTEGESSPLGGINKDGVFVRTGAQTGYYIAPHASGSSFTLKCVAFDNGTSVVTTIDGTPSASIDKISACVDDSTAHNLHVTWVRDGGNPVTNGPERLCYARTESGQWKGIAQQLNSAAPAEVRGTGIIASSLTDVRLYFTLATTTSVSLLKATPKYFGSVLFIIHTTFPQQEVDPGVICDNPLTVMRVNLADRIYYFSMATPTATTRSLKRSGDTIIANIPAVNGLPPAPRSIAVATAPDGRQRIAWYEARAREIHYVKPKLPTGDAYNSGQPVQFAAGALPDADVLGLQFGADGRPYILSRRTLTEGYISFPKDDFDYNGNGRKDLLDNAFNSDTAGFALLSAGPGTGTFKVQFPTMRQATATNGVVSSESSDSGQINVDDRYRYEIETSADMVNWAKINSSAGATYTFVANGGSGVNQRRIFTATLQDSTATKRFARMNVTRLGNPY
ncbi:hypothetical protein [Haloferula sp. BvORR071]|uniref:hypothetical protein n=1 Tax=Haloferula sp. BvORR071 TaxID=1396141 RepID=UPI002240F946|nr:hypothetical protein [Haloferula sp. BvORR071]